MKRLIFINKNLKSNFYRLGLGLFISLFIITQSAGAQNLGSLANSTDKIEAIESTDEPDLQLEAWMYDPFYWLPNDTETELSLEAWMYDPFYWLPTELVMDDELTLEPWMYDSLYWLPTEAAEADLEF